MKVNFDVVFNHVYEKERFALDTLVPNYYFLMNQNGEFSNGSFCGNDIDTQPIMSKRYFINTCRKIISLYDIDGFRFDLMGILDLNFMNELSEECRRIKPGFMIYGEGWNMPKLFAGKFACRPAKSKPNAACRPFFRPVSGNDSRFQRRSCAKRLRQRQFG